jgi:hypothetical protein
MLVLSEPTRSNGLLAALPDAEWRRWPPQLETVEMQVGRSLRTADTHLARELEAGLPADAEQGGSRRRQAGARGEFNGLEIATGEMLIEHWQVADGQRDEAETGAGFEDHQQSRPQIMRHAVAIAECEKASPLMMILPRRQAELQTLAS